MKHITKNVVSLSICVAAILFSLTGCYETHYYHHYHHHTRDWYDHHHTPPPAGIDFNVDVRNW